MISIARILGAPVMLPPGKLEARACRCVTPGRSRPVTVETKCCTCANRSSLAKSGTITDPYSQNLPRSLRNRSVIITNSARSFSLDCNS